MSRLKNVVLNTWLWLQDADVPTMVFIILMLLIIWGVHYELSRYERYALDQSQQEYNRLPHRRGK